METSNFIALSVFLALCFIPVAFVQFKRKAKANKMKQRIKNLAAHSSAQILEWDIWDTCSIAIDESKKYLFFSDIETENDVALTIKFSDIKKCVVFNGNKASSANASIMSLIITTKDEDIELEFYNSSKDGFVLSGQLQLIEKWNKIIRANIK